MQLLSASCPGVIHAVVSRFRIAVPVGEVFEARSDIWSNDPHDVVDFDWLVQNGRS